MKPLLVNNAPVDWELRLILTHFSGYIESLDSTKLALDQTMVHEPIRPEKIAKLFILIDGICPPKFVAEYILTK
jgi:hypothetical protein